MHFKKMLFILMIVSTRLCNGSVKYSSFDIYTGFIMSAVVGMCGIMKYHQISSYNRKIDNWSNGLDKQQKGYEKVVAAALLSLTGFSSSLYILKNQQQ